LTAFKGRATASLLSVVKIITDLASVSQTDWNSLIGPGSTPTIAGSVPTRRSATSIRSTAGGRTTLTKWDGDRILAAAPAYEKDLRAHYRPYWLDEFGFSIGWERLNPRLTLGAELGCPVVQLVCATEEEALEFSEWAVGAMDDLVDHAISKFKSYKFTPRPCFLRLGRELGDSIEVVFAQRERRPVAGAYLPFFISRSPLSEHRELPREGAFSDGRRLFRRSPEGAPRLPSPPAPRRSLAGPRKQERLARYLASEREQVLEVVKMLEPK
jgi:hypothetical protein